MDTEKIKQIISLFENSNVALMELEVDNIKIKLEKAKPQMTMISSGEKECQVLSKEIHCEPSNGIEEAKSEPVVEEVKDYIKSPLVGTFYTAPSVASDPYVKCDDRVKQGDVVCIIEAMKVMNEIKAPKDGVIKEILIHDGDMVQFDEPLMVIGE